MENADLFRYFVEDYVNNAIKCGVKILALAASIAAMPAWGKSAKDYWDELIDNSIAFNNKYLGKPITVDGYVQTLSSSSPGFGQISVGEKPDRFGLPSRYGVICMLSGPAEIQRFSTLSKGAHISLTGEVIQSPGDIMVRNCTYTIEK